MRLYCYKTPRDQHRCYRYIVQKDAFAHIAFHRKSSLKRWLVERKLTLEFVNRRPPQGWGDFAYFQIVGQYNSEYCLDEALFDSIAAPTTKVMSNGSYTLAKLLNENGVVVVLSLVPNANRATFDRVKTDLTHG